MLWNASSICFGAAVAIVVLGMIWDLLMAIADDHSAFPAHAHLDLLGGMSLFLFGIYCRLHPVLERSKLALTQVWLWIAGTVIQAIGVSLLTTGTAKAEPVAAVGSLLVLIAMLMFGWLAFRSESNAGASPRAA